MALLECFFIVAWDLDYQQVFTFLSPEVPKKLELSKSGDLGAHKQGIRTQKGLGNLFLTQYMYLTFYTSNLFFFAYLKIHFEKC